MTPAEHAALSAELARASPHDFSARRVYTSRPLIDRFMERQSEGYVISRT